MKPKAVLFDAGGTLVTMHPTKFGDVVEPMSGRRPDPERMIDAHYLAMDAIHRNRHQLEGPNWWHWWLEQFLTFAGLEPSDEAVAALAGTHGLWQHPLPGALETVRAARRAGYRVAVVSNADGHVARDLEAAGFGGQFEIIVDSTVVGISKPDPRIFHHALGALGLEPEDTWYVGDSPLFDWQGSHNAGLAQFVLVDPFGLSGYSPQVARIDELMTLLAAFE